MIASSPSHRRLLGAAIALSASLVLSGCDSAGAGTNSRAAAANPADLALIQDVVNQVEKNYVEPVPHSASSTTR